LKACSRIESKRFYFNIGCITLPKKTLEVVINRGNHVIAQVKTNQQTLFEDCVSTSNHMKPDDRFIAL